MSVQTPTAAPADGLTIILTTSPVPSAPSTELLTDVFDSFAEYCPSLLDCRVIVVFDTYERVTERAQLKKGSVTPQQARDFEGYIANVKQLVLQRFGYLADAQLGRSVGVAEFGSPLEPNNAIDLVQSRTADERVSFIEATRCLGFSLAVRSALRLTSTPYVWVHQHDWVLTTAIPVTSLLTVLHENDSDENLPVRYICFPSVRLLNYAGQSDTVRFPAFRQLTTKLRQDFSVSAGVERLPLTPLFLWHDKPHVASSAHYVRRIFPSRYATKRGAFIEDTVGQKARERMKGDESEWYRFATWLYYPGNGETLCLRHLDGRFWRGKDAEVKAREYWRARNGVGTVELDELSADGIAMGEACEESSVGNSATKDQPERQRAREQLAS